LVYLDCWCKGMFNADSQKSLTADYYDPLLKSQQLIRSRLSMKHIKIFLRVLFVWMILLFVFNMLSRTYGIGYTASLIVTDSGMLSYGRSGRFACWSAGYLYITYNPVLFPVSHILGDGQYYGEFRVVHYPEDNLVEVAALTIIREEIWRNLPYFFVLSFVLALVLEKLLSFIRRMPMRGQELK